MVEQQELSQSRIYRNDLTFNNTAVGDKISPVSEISKIERRSIKRRLYQNSMPLENEQMTKNHNGGAAGEDIERNLTIKLVDRSKCREKEMSRGIRIQGSKKPLPQVV